MLVGHFFQGPGRSGEIGRRDRQDRPRSCFASLATAWKVGSADFAGRPWLLNVWATWCVECHEEHETLLAIAKENRLPMMGLNWNDERALALRWLSQLGNPYVSVAFDPEGRVAIDWGVYGARNLPYRRRRTVLKSASAYDPEICAKIPATDCRAAGALKRSSRVSAFLRRTLAIVPPGVRDPSSAALYRLVNELRCSSARTTHCGFQRGSREHCPRSSQLIAAGQSDADIRLQDGPHVISALSSAVGQNWLLWAGPHCCCSRTRAASVVIARRARARGTTHPRSTRTRSS